MKSQYDFSKGKRGAVLPPEATKERITIRLDRDVIAWFRQQVNDAGGRQLPNADQRGTAGAHRAAG